MSGELEKIFLLNPPESASTLNYRKCNPPQVKLENVENFSYVCRLCASVTDLVIPIFEGEGKQNNLADKINQHLPIQVSDEDGLPGQVCYQCASTLLAWHELAQCSRHADAALRARRLARPGTSSDLNGNDHSENEQPRLSGGGELRCGYCGVREATRATLDAHLVAAHARLVFQCEECDRIVDRRCLLAHMSRHAEEYAAAEAAAAPPPPPLAPPLLETGAHEQTSTQLSNESDAAEASAATELDSCSNTISSTSKPKRKVVSKKKQPSTSRGESKMQSNEASPSLPPLPELEEAFSDGSEAEDGFGPLPAAVLRAIDELQDERAAAAPAPARAAPAPRHRRPRTCAQCGKTYTASSSYFYHVKHAHAAPAAPAATCAECGQGFRTRASLARHAPVHAPEPAFSCDRCGKKFRTAAGRYVHARTHGDVRRWPCSACPQRFRWRAQLARHSRRQHGGARPHACPQCPRTFAVRYDLRRHAATHAAHARLSCPATGCSATFAQPRYLRAHERRKHPKETPTAAAAHNNQPSEPPK